MIKTWVREVKRVTALTVLVALPAFAEEPPVEIIRMETTAMLEAKVKAAIAPEAIAKEMKLSWPAAAPTKTPQQVEAELAQRLKSRSGGSTVNIDETALRNRAAQKVPLAKPGETVALTLATGGELRGELQSYAEGAVKVSGRTVRTSALTQQSLALLDPKVNAAAREKWMQRERVRIMSVQDTTVIGGSQKLRAQLYQAAGYVYWRQQWISPVELLDKAVAYKRQKLTKELRPKIVQEVAARYGFSWQEGKWVPLKVIAEPVAATGTGIKQPPPGIPEPGAIPVPAPEAPPTPTGVTNGRRGPPAADSIEALFHIEIEGGPPGPVKVPPPIDIRI
jgi:hypothetical protein